MDLFTAMTVSATGLNAQRTVINVISANLANAQTTRTEEGGPYRRKQALLSPAPPAANFPDFLSRKIDPQATGVKAEVVEDAGAEFKVIHDPSHPDADENGSVALPNVNIMEEMVNLMRATRSYEANVSTFNAAKHMALKALEIGK
jgi:flagellar basal-body rod protein FlgC